MDGDSDSVLHTLDFPEKKQKNKLPQDKFQIV